MKNITEKDLNKIAQIKPSEFVEGYCGMKLFSWQKAWIDSCPKVAHYAQQRMNNKRVTYFNLLCNHWYWMKDNDLVVVWIGREQKLMNKDEFANYLMKDYWL